VADRPEDNTAEVASSFESRVLVRDTGAPGKAAALNWFLEEQPLETGETLVVLDADNRIPPDAMTRIAEEVQAGHDVVQCYLDVTNPDDSLLAEASALSYWAGNRMVQLARSNIGWSADLGGTGMAISAKALGSVGGFGDSLTEDQDLGVRLFLAGYRVHWIHDVRIRDEKPSTLAVAVRQRARWMAGKREARRHTAELLRQGTPAAIDMAVRLWQPGRSFVALLSGVLTVLAALGGSALLLPWQVWASATFIQVFQPIPYLAKEGVGARRLFRYPLLTLIAALWIPIRFLSHRVEGWYHTPHRPSSSEVPD
jgi:cellulose synthase/poly-beta-1,6-N-acetylglucosamine synthase-like glycosyltransferase